MIEISVPWGELALYQGYAQNVGKPYLDFQLEYPPLAFIFFKLANVFGKQYFTLMWYGIVVLAVLISCLVIKRLKGNPYIFLACVLPLGGLFWDRFDIFPAMFSLLAVYLATKKSFWSLPVLTLGILTKLYPVILLPVILGSLLKRKGYFALLYGAFISLAFVGYSFLFFPNWFNCVFGFHGNRGTQIESIMAIPKLLDENSVVEFKHNTFEIR